MVPSCPLEVDRRITSNGLRQIVVYTFRDLSDLEKAAKLVERNDLLAPNLDQPPTSSQTFSNLAGLPHTHNVEK